MTGIAVAGFWLGLPETAAAQQNGTPQPVDCSSTPGNRTECVANTTSGVALVKSTGKAECLLGKTWGYDERGIWVSDGCGGIFQPGMVAVPRQAESPQTVKPAVVGETTEQSETWGEFDPGKGFLVGRSSLGELGISAYGLVRYMNQMPGSQTFTDHLGNERPVDARHDIYSHRVMVFFKGWLGTPKLIYNIVLWTVNATDQDAIFAVVGYQFGRKFSVYGGLNGLPGTRSLQGSHPYWLGNDRVMADEFFRPYFASGVWAQGEVLPGLWYNVMVGNNNSALGARASQLDRQFTRGASAWWMPTTKEFGPRGAYGDFERHEKLATRFGVSSTWSPEERFTNAQTGATENTTLRLADSVNVFDPGALSSGVTVERANLKLLSFDAGIKYKGFFLQTEIYHRWLDGFVADGPLPVSTILDRGFFVSGAFYVVPKKLEIYAGTSQVFGDKSAGFGNSSEYLAGLNFYPVNSRNHRLNVQVIDVNRSPVSSTFGYYTAGQNGTTVAMAFSVFF